MFHGIMSAGFQNPVETDQIGFHINIRMINGIADPGLCRQIDDDIRSVYLKHFFNQCRIGNGTFDKKMVYRAFLCRLLNHPQTVLLQSGIIIIIQIIQADNGTGGHLC